MMAFVKRRKRKARSLPRRQALRLGVVSLAVFAVWGVAAEWFVHHPREWIESQHPLVTQVMLALGNPLADITDSLDLTGYDTVCEYDTEAPSGSVLFAGAPKRVSDPAPNDIRVIDKGEFLIGWSDSLRHPVWCAYHVVRDAHHENAKRPAFFRDRSVKSAPDPNDYTKSGYDRGHMVPNYAIVTRYGETAQRKTFLMSNIAPQSPALNRGVWKDVEHRIANLWTARYGEIWVVVGSISPKPNAKTISGTGIDIPSEYYQVIIAQEGMDVRALAMTFTQDTDWNDWAARHLVTIDEIERRSGLDFNPDLPSFIQEPLESDLPSRLWPIRPLDIIGQLLYRFN